MVSDLDSRANGQLSSNRVSPEEMRKSPAMATLKVQRSHVTNQGAEVLIKRRQTREQCGKEVHTGSQVGHGEGARGILSKVHDQGLDNHGVRWCQGPKWGH